MSRIIKASTLAFLAATAVSGAAHAGGFDRGGVNIDLLFSPERITSEATATFVAPQRSIDNIARGSNSANIPAVRQGAIDAAVAANRDTLVRSAVAAGFILQTQDLDAIEAFVLNPANQATIATFLSNPAQAAAVDATIAAPQFAPTLSVIQAGAEQAITAQVNAGLDAALVPATQSNLDIDSDFVVPRLGWKMSVTDDAACLGTYSEPYGADANYGTNNAYSATAVSFGVATRDYGLTCSYRFDGPELGIGKSSFRIIGGVSYQELTGTQQRQSFLDFANAGINSIGGITNTAGIGRFDVEGDSIGYRIGAAFEVPDIALRAVVLYHSKYDYDLSGFQDNRGFGALIPGTALVPITMQTEIPQAVEVKLQTGVAEGTLAFLNVKWQDWSQLGIIPIVGGRNPATGGASNLSFDPLYRDGWTVTAGVGKVINDFTNGSLSLTWDRGTSTTTGTQTDTWTMAAGVSINPNDNVEFRFGGALGLLTSGESLPAVGGDPANNITYSFGNDVVSAVSGGLRVKF
ncbi:MAG: outer membrane protein transport protein [Ahrensia sp.]